MAANEEMTPIPSRVYNPSPGGHVTGADMIVDDDLNLIQKDINSPSAKSPVDNSDFIVIRDVNGVPFKAGLNDVYNALDNKRYAIMGSYRIDIGLIIANGKDYVILLANQSSLKRSCSLDITSLSNSGGLNFVGFPIDCHVYMTHDYGIGATYSNKYITSRSNGMTPPVFKTCTYNGTTWDCILVQHASLYNQAGTLYVTGFGNADVKVVEATEVTNIQDA